jgi:hypothetical protein
MTTQPQLLNVALDLCDVVYTPDWIARDMVEYFQPSGRILEPSSGDGAFLKYLPTADWCEIEKGRDFFSCTDHYDWIIGNPPYKIKLEWLRHSMEIGENIVYLFPCNTPYNSSAIMLDMKTWGGLVHMRYYAPGGKIGFPFGYPVGALHFRRDYRGPMATSYFETEGITLL